MPKKLHWFRWEAAITWLSGLLLFMLVYYHGGLMISTEDSRISQATAVWLSLGLLVAAYLLVTVGRAHRSRSIDKPAPGP